MRQLLYVSALRLDRSRKRSDFTIRECGPDNSLACIVFKVILYMLGILNVFLRHVAAIYSIEVRNGIALLPFVGGWHQRYLHLGSGSRQRTTQVLIESKVFTIEIYKDNACVCGRLTGLITTRKSISCQILCIAKRDSSEKSIEHLEIHCYIPVRRQLSVDNGC